MLLLLFRVRYVVVMLLLIMVINWNQGNVGLCVEKGGAERKLGAQVLVCIAYVVRMVVMCCCGDKDVHGEILEALEA